MLFGSLEVFKFLKYCFLWSGTFLSQLFTNFKIWNMNYTSGIRGPEPVGPRIKQRSVDPCHSYYFEHILKQSYKTCQNLFVTFGRCFVHFKISLQKLRVFISKFLNKTRTSISESLVHIFLMNQQRRFQLDEWAKFLAPIMISQMILFHKSFSNWPLQPSTLLVKRQMSAVGLVCITVSYKGHPISEQSWRKWEWKYNYVLLTIRVSCLQSPAYCYQTECPDIKVISTLILQQFLIIYKSSSTFRINFNKQLKKAPRWETKTIWGLTFIWYDLQSPAEMWVFDVHTLVPSFAVRCESPRV